MDEDLPKRSGKQSKVREKSVKSKGILKTILSGNPVIWNCDLFQFASWARQEEGIYAGRTAITVFAFNESTYQTMPPKDRQVLMQMDAFKRSEYVKTYTCKFNLMSIYTGLGKQKLSA